MSKPKTTKPTSISILGINFKIEYQKKLLSESEEVVGLMSGSEQTITLQSDLVGPELESVLLHESIHAILYASGQSQRLDPDQEEGIVLALEHGLRQIYQRITN